nr:uncharacterized protein LOC118877219 [Drosophila suzukii]
MKFLVVILCIALGVEGAIPKDWHPYKTAILGINFPMCANCSDIKNFRANVGFTCHFDDDLAIEENFQKLENKHPECMPNEFTLTPLVIR